MKKRAISLLLTLCMVLGLLPGMTLPATAATPPHFPQQEAGIPKLLDNGRYFVCNGADVLIEWCSKGDPYSKVSYRLKSSDDYTVLYENVDLAYVDIYGGSEKFWQAPSWGIRYQSKITMNGGVVQNIYGGGMYAEIDGDASIEIYDGHVRGSVYGCGGVSANNSTAGCVNGNLNITVWKGTIDGNICGESPYGAYYGTNTLAHRIYVDQAVKLSGKVYGTKPKDSGTYGNCVGEVHLEDKAEGSSFANLACKTAAGYDVKGTLSPFGDISTSTGKTLTVADNANVSLLNFAFNLGTVNMGKNATLTLAMSRNKTAENRGTLRLAQGAEFVVPADFTLKNAGTIDLLGGGSVTGAGKLTGPGKVLFPATAELIQNIPDTTYTGSAITPTITLANTQYPILNWKFPVAIADYNITYNNNTKAGEASATLTSKYNPGFSVSTTFHITKAGSSISAAEFIPSAALVQQADGSFHVYDTAEKHSLRVKLATDAAGDIGTIGNINITAVNTKDSAKKVSMTATPTGNTPDQEGYYKFEFKPNFDHAEYTIELEYTGGDNLRPSKYSLSTNVLKFAYSALPASQRIALWKQTPYNIYAGTASGTTKIVCGDGHTGNDFNLANWTISPSAEAADFKTNDITMNSGTVGTIVAGSTGKQFDSAKATINGGTLTNLYSSSAYGQTNRAELVVTNGQVDVIRGGRRTMNLYVAVTGGQVGEVTTVSDHNGESAHSMHLLVTGGTVGKVSGALNRSSNQKSVIISAIPQIIPGADTFGNRLYYNGAHYVLENSVEIWSDLTLPVGTLVTTKTSALVIPSGKTLTVPVGTKLYGAGTLTVQNGGHVALTGGIATLAQDSYVVTGSPIAPPVTVKLLDKTFTKDKDYTVSYANHTAVGSATVTVTAMEGSALSGEAVLTYQIRPTLGTVSLTGYKPIKPYTGTPIANPTSEQVVKNNNSGDVSFAWYQGTLTAAEIAGTLPMSSNPKELGNYTLLVQVTGDTTYTASSAIVPITIGTSSDASVATLSGTQAKPESGWYTGDVTLNAPEGYTISSSNASNTTWSATLTIATDMNKEVDYYLKKTAEGYITDKKTILVQRDTVVTDFDLVFSDRTDQSYTATIQPNQDLSGMTVCRYYDYANNYVKGDEKGDPDLYVNDAYVIAHGKDATGLSFTGVPLPGAKAKVWLMVEDAAGNKRSVTKTDTKEAPQLDASKITGTVSGTYTYTFDNQLKMPKPSDVTLYYDGVELPREFYNSFGGFNEDDYKYPGGKGIKIPGEFARSAYTTTIFKDPVWINYTIDKMPLTADMLSFSPSTDAILPYTGRAQEPWVKVQFGEYTLTSYCTKTYSNNTAVGTATVTVHAKPDENFTGSAQINFTITPKPVQVGLYNLNDVTYNGKEITSVPENRVSLNGASRDELKYRFTDADGTVSASIKNAGTYKVEAYVEAAKNHAAGTSNQVSLTIQKMSEALEDPYSILVERGKSCTVDFGERLRSRLLEGDTIDLTKLSDTGNSSFTDTTFTYTDVSGASKPYTVTYHAENYNIKLNYALVVTNKILLDESRIKANIPAEVPYTGQPCRFTPSIDIEGSGVRWDYYYQDLSNGVWNNTAPKEMGKYKVQITYESDTHIARTMKEFRITKGDSAITLTADKATPTYDFNENITLTATVALPKVRTLSLPADPNQVAFYLGETQIGTAGVTVNGAIGTAVLNYQIPSKTFQVGNNVIRAVYGGSGKWNSAQSGGLSITVNAAPIHLASSISATSRPYALGNTEVALANVALDPSGIPSGDIADLTLSGERVGSIGSANAGEYTITQIKLSLTGTLAPYYRLVLPDNLKVTITSQALSNDAPNAVTIADIAPLTYTGSALTPAVVVKDGETPLTKDTDYTVAYSGNTDAGTATATLTFKGNYSGEMTKNFTIDKAGSTVTPEAGTNATYGDTITLTATVGIQEVAPLAAFNQVEFFCGGTSLGSADVNAGVATLAYNTADKKLKIGDNIITATFGGNDNLLLNDSKTNTITVNLKAKAVTATVSGTITKVYDNTTAATVTLDVAKVSPDDVITVTAAATYNNADVGIDKTINFSNLIQDGMHSNYYTVSAPASTTGAITAKPITVASVTVEQKTYDTATTATITAMTFHDLAAGDSLTYSVDVTATATFADAAAANGKTVNIADIVLSSTKAKNYSLSAATFETTGTIAPADFTAPATIAITTDTNVAEKLDVGDVLTATVTGLQGTLTYQWQNNGVDMPDKTGNTYTMEAGKTGTISCVVTSAGNVVGEQTSNTLEIGKIALEGSISITGVDTLGSVLTLAVDGITTPAATYTILWSTGATDTTYTVATADLGKTITVTITATGDYTGTLTAELAIPAVAPDAPAITAVAGDSKVTVSWAAPFNGGSAITGYTLTVTPGSPIAVAPGATSYEVTGLTNDTEYTFTLVATNAVGGSAASGEATATPIGMRTVTFGTNGGNTIDPVQVANGGTITAPTPAKSGYDFAGWFTDAELTVSFVQSTPITADMTLYAKWTVQQTSDPDPVNNKPTVSFNRGGTATATNSGNVTITPDTGYQIGKITINGKEVTIPENGKLTGLTRKDKVEITFEKIPEEKPQETTPVWERFTDIPAKSWYTESVQFVVDNGLFSGTSKTTFCPKAATTRGMLWTVLYRHAGATTKGEGKMWYADAQAWAKEIGISDGKNPEGEISREQLATILYRYAKGKPTTADMSKFSDTNEISGFAAEAMNWAVEQGILQGIKGKLSPKASASRAEVAAMVTRFVKGTAK